MTEVLQQLREALCGALSVREVPCGYAVGMPFETVSGDRIGFYVVRVSEDTWRLEDGGDTVPWLEAAGVDLKSETRKRIFDDILRRAEAVYDQEEGVLRTRTLAKSELGRTAVRFLTALIRIQDLEFVTAENVTSVFRDDLKRDLERELGRLGALVKENVSPYPEVEDYRADFVVRFRDRSTPLAIFVATAAAHILEGALLRHKVRHDLGKPLKVVALLQSAKPRAVSERIMRIALNELDRALVFENPRKLASELEGLTVH